MPTRGPATAAQVLGKVPAVTPHVPTHAEKLWAAEVAYAYMFEAEQVRKDCVRTGRWDDMRQYIAKSACELLMRLDALRAEEAIVPHMNAEQRELALQEQYSDGRRTRG